MPANLVTYGILVSSAQVQISSVNVIDPSGKIVTAGISITSSSRSSINYSSVTVTNNGANGIQIIGSSMTLISYSIAQANNSMGIGGAIYLQGASSNTFTLFIASNSAGHGMYLDLNSNSNTISLSTMTGGGTGYALNLNGASTNTISHSLITSSGGSGYGVYLNANSNFNSITFSTVTSYNGYSSLELNQASSNTIANLIILNGAQLFGNSNGNVLSYIIINSQNGGSSGYGIYLNLASSNTIVNSIISNPPGYGVYLNSGVNGNIIAFSTITSDSSYDALYIQQGSSNVITNSYMQGAGNAANIGSSVGTVISSSVLVATGTASNGLNLGGSNINIFVSSSSIRGGPQGSGVFIGGWSWGSLNFTSVTISGAQSGMFINEQFANTVLSIASMTFQNWLPGATAINFQNGPFVSTFSNVNFADTNIAVNVNASMLPLGSQIIMQQSTGTRMGPAYADDPQGYVYWPGYAGANLPLGCGTGFNVTKSVAGIMRRSRRQ